MEKYKIEKKNLKQKNINIKKMIIIEQNKQHDNFNYWLT